MNAKPVKASPPPPSDNQAASVVSPPAAKRERKPNWHDLGAASADACAASNAGKPAIQQVGIHRCLRQALMVARISRGETFLTL